MPSFAAGATTVAVEVESIQSTASTSSGTPFPSGAGGHFPEPQPAPAPLGEGGGHHCTGILSQRRRAKVTKSQRVTKVTKDTVSQTVSFQCQFESQSESVPNMVTVNRSVTVASTAFSRQSRGSMSAVSVMAQPTRPPAPSASRPAQKKTAARSQRCMFTVQVQISSVRFKSQPSSGCLTVCLCGPLVPSRRPYSL